MAETMPGVDLSVLIVNWNSASYVRECVKSLRANPTQTSLEIIVVDNASFDSCGRDLAAEYPDVVFVQSDRNLGFGGANNLAAQHAHASTLLFLNPDTEVHAGAIDRLFAHLQGLPHAGVLGCRLLNTDGSLQTSCVQALPTIWNQAIDTDVLRRLVPRASVWGTQAFLESGSVPVEVEAVSGACMLMRREVFEAVGGFSPAFFMYGEDLDLCDRIRRAGYPNFYVGECEVVHHGGGSSRHVRTFSVVMLRESVALLLRRTRGPVASATYRAGLVVMACVRLIALMLLAPLFWLRRGIASWKQACVKWIAILGWGLGIDRRAHRAIQARQSVSAVSAGA
jgi:GT2 family glycosyltransferase